MATDKPDNGELFAQFFREALADSDREPDAHTATDPETNDFNAFFGIN